MSLSTPWMAPALMVSGLAHLEQPQPVVEHQTCGLSVSPIPFLHLYWINWMVAMTRS